MRYHVGRVFAYHNTCIYKPGGDKVSMDYKKSDTFARTFDRVQDKYLVIGQYPNL